MPGKIVTLELQYSAVKFLAMITERIKETFKLPSLGGVQGPDGGTYYIDRVEFGSAALDLEKSQSYYILSYYFDKPSFDQVDGKQLRMLQPATIFLVKEKDLIESGAAAPPSTRIPIQVTAAFRISLRLLPVKGALQGTGQPYLYFEFDELVVDQNIQQLIQPLLPSLAEGLSWAEPLLGSMPSASLFPTNFANGGIMADESKSRVSIVLTRGLYDPSGTAVQYFWAPFFKGEHGKIIEDILQGKDFALALNKSVFEQHVTNAIYSTVSDPDFLSKSDARLKGKQAFLHNNALTTAEWSTGLPYHVGFHLDLPHWCNLIDIGADVTFDCYFWPVSKLGSQDPGAVTLINNTLIVEVFQDAKISDWDKIACAAFQTVRIVSTFSPLLLLLFPFGFVPVVVVLSGAILGIFTAILAALSASFKAGQLPVENVEKISDGHWKIEYSMPQLKKAGVSLERVVGLNRHLVLSGTQSVSVKKQAELLVDVYPFQLGLAAIFSCDGSTNEKIAAQIRSDPISYLLGYATIELKKQGDLPLAINGVQILNDGTHINKVFSHNIEQTGPNQYRVTLDFDFKKARSEGYFNDPYHCVVLIQTTAGARIITLGPVKMPNQSELEDLIYAAEKRAIAICTNVVNINRGVHMEWWIDPDPFELVSLGVMVSLAGLPPGTPVRLEATGGQVIDRSVADRNGRLQVSGLIQLSGLSDADGLTLRGGPGVQVGGQGGPRVLRLGEPVVIPTQVNVRQSGLRLLTSIELGNVLLGAQLAAIRGVRTLLCVLPGEIRLYNLSDPQLPRLFRHREFESLRGALLSGDTIYAWGDCGLVVWDPEGVVGQAGCQFPKERPIRAAALSSGFFYLLAGDELVIFDRRFTRLGAIPAAEVITLAASCGALAIGYRDRVDILTLERPQAPRVVASWPVADVKNLFPVTGFNRPCALLARDSEGRHTLLDVSARESDPGILACYGGPPWFADYHRHGNLLVHAPLSATAIALYVEARTESRSVAAMPFAREI